MRLTYSDNCTTTELIFKKLLLVSSELAFYDWPSIGLGKDYGSVGQPSLTRKFLKEFQGSPIKLIADEPPNSKFNSDFYHAYFEKDLENPNYLQTLFEGIQNGWVSSAYFDLTKNNTSGDFKDYKHWILQNRDQFTPEALLEVDTPEEAFRVTNKHEALFNFKMLAFNYSMAVTSALYISNKYDNSPIGVHPTINKIIAHRLSDSVYNGQKIKSKQLGYKLMDFILPDEAILKLSFEDIIRFREKTKSYFEGWEIEMKRIEATIFKDQDILTESDITQLLDATINPKLFELTSEINRIKDDQFKNLLKSIKNTLLSCITLGTLSGLSIPGAIAAFIGINIKTPKLTDDAIDSHFDLKHKLKSNGLTYLLKAKEFVK